MVQSESATNPSPMTEITIQMENVYKDYTCGLVLRPLRDINLSAAQGERVGIIGSSGSRKSSPTFIALNRTGKRR